MNHLLCFGFGFTAHHVAKILDPQLWKITGTSRTDEGAEAISALGYEGLTFDSITQIPETVTHILSSVAPDANGDPVLNKLTAALTRHGPKLQWVGYLSTTGVYGDRQGDVIDETAALLPNGERGMRRVLAEKAWAAIPELPLHIFRLPGIYGPGRNQLEQALSGKARRIIKEGQIFSRIHVEDIAGILKASMLQPHIGRIYNVADDEPCPPQDVVSFACALLGMNPPPEIPFEKADLSPMAKSFYADSKRVSNARIKQELGYVLKYPNYREGLTALFNSLSHQRVRPI